MIFFMITQSEGSIIVGTPCRHRLLNLLMGLSPPPPRIWYTISHLHLGSANILRAIPALQVQPANGTKYSRSFYAAPPPPPWSRPGATFYTVGW